MSARLNPRRRIAAREAAAKAELLKKMSDPVWRKAQQAERRRAQLAAQRKVSS